MNAKRDPRLPLEDVRSRFAVIWFSGSGILFFVIVLQSILGHYGTHIDAVWSWFVPTVLPTLALILGVIGAGAMTARDKRTVEPRFARLANRVSIAYLAVLGVTIVLEPASPFDFLELFKLSNYWLSPIQGLAVAAIGFVFASQKSE